MSNYSNNNENEILGWDDEISGEVNEFIELEPGIYKFTITNLERKYTDKATNAIPAGTPYAMVSVQVERADGKTKVMKERLYLMRKFEWKLSQVFVSVGLIQEGVRGAMPWNRLVGSVGVCEVEKRTYNGNTYDNIKSFLTPKQAQEKVNQAKGNTSNTGNTSWNAGQF